MTKGPAERGHPLNVQQRGQWGQSPGRHDGQNGGEHDGPSRQRSPHGMAHLWRHDRLDQLIGSRAFRVADETVEESEIDRDGGRDLVRRFGGQRQRQQRPRPLAAQPIDHRHQRAGIPNGGGDGGRRGTEVLGQQPVAQPGNGTGQGSIERGVENEVALGIEAHGAIGEVGGPDSRHLVVGDQHLRVDVEAVVAESGNGRIAEPQATVAIAFHQPSQEPRPQDAHGALFEPAALLAREHGDDLGSVRLGEPSRQGGADGGRGQVLALDVDPTAGAGDGGSRGLEHLLHAGPVVGGGNGAGDAERHVADGGFHLARPKIVRGRAGRPRKHLARAGTPARPHEIPERGGRLSLDHDLHVVHRRVRPTGRIDPPRIGRVVGRRIPTPDGEVEASREGQGVVDHHDLLVVRGPNGMGAVQLEDQPGMRAPGETVGGQPLALERIDERKVPAQGVDLELGASGQGVV